MSKLLILFGASLFAWFGVNWDSIDGRIQREFPGVPFVEAEQLLGALQDGADSAPALFDVREPEEYAISRLPGAQRAATAAAIAAQVPDLNTPIVVYCSVGYRSAAVAADLQAQGYVDVRNLRHSIFAWANRGLPMVNAAGATNKVHPYNRIWGSLVAPPLRQLPR